MSVASCVSATNVRCSIKQCIGVRNETRQIRVKRQPPTAGKTRSKLGWASPNRKTMSSA
ncbi:uncharacterized protein CLUP02_00286 [Colletotrichum lupini]|uniref:Uncharacterized protein n=1 Tax=Colletotrichum lupini TaxID=145971 RepID=A0A9Q8W846_9PEZI|nr:uncharacterized protein CLUP02_00286 [Colletotrichum lupini]UQC73641.1 hypothetical protein CLUP02_00286 [Colletotrichum lupini]